MYAIKVKNTKGNFLTGALFKSKKKAESFVQMQRDGDRKYNTLGLRNKKGQVSKITNKYSIVKASLKGKRR